MYTQQKFLPWYLLLILTLTMGCGESRETTGLRQGQNVMLGSDRDHNKTLDSEEEEEKALAIAPFQQATTPADRIALLKKKWRAVTLPGNTQSDEELWKKTQINFTRWNSMPGFANSGRPWKMKENRLAFKNIIATFRFYIDGVGATPGENLASDVSKFREVLTVSNAKYIYDPSVGKNSKDKKATEADKYQITKEEAEVLLEYLDILEAFAAAPQS